MAKRPVTGAINPVYPNAKFPDEIDPSEYPPTYASIAKGRCLEPVFADGECIAFSKDAEILPGDYVGICLVPDAVQPDELPHRLKRLYEAIERGEARCTEISRALLEYRGPSGRDAAEAMLTGGDTVVMAAPNLEQMEAERAALRAGIKDLLGRVDDARASISGIERECFAAVGQMTWPLVEQIERELQAAAEVIATSYAAIAAVRAATRCGGDLEHRAREACEAVSGNSRLIPFVRSIPVPEELFATLRRLDGKGKALPAGLMAAVHRR